MTPLEAFGNRVGLLRQAAGFTQATLAEMVGLARSSIANIERGEQEPGATMVPKLARALGVTCDELFGAEDVEQSKLPWIELVTRVTAEERSYLRLADSCWSDMDIVKAIRYRGIAEGLEMARNHHARVIAEANEATKSGGAS